MAYIKVDTDALGDSVKKLSKLQERMDNVQQRLSTLSSQLDWEIKGREELENRLNQLKSQIGTIGTDIGNAAKCLEQVSNEYIAAHNDAKEEVEALQTSPDRSYATSEAMLQDPNIPGSVKESIRDSINASKRSRLPRRRTVEIQTYPGKISKETAKNNLKDPNVTLVQERLNVLGYQGADNLELKTNGNFGPNSIYAVGFFQINNGIEATGIVDEITWNKLFSTSAVSKAQGMVGNTPLGEPVDYIKYNTTLSDLDLLARTLYSECDLNRDNMLAVAATIINRQRKEADGGSDRTYYETFTYKNDEYIGAGDREDKENTLRNVVLTPVQYTGLTGSEGEVGLGGSGALKPKNNPEKWVMAVDIANRMLKDPKSLEVPEGVENCVFFKTYTTEEKAKTIGATRYYKDYNENKHTVIEVIIKTNKETHKTTETKKFLTNVYVYGDNIFGA